MKKPERMESGAEKTLGSHQERNYTRAFKTCALHPAVCDYWIIEDLRIVQHSKDHPEKAKILPDSPISIPVYADIFGAILFAALAVKSKI